MKLIKPLVLAIALAGSFPIVQAQVQVDITAADLLGGTADSRLQEVGRQARAEGKGVVVTAPVYWHERIAAQIAAGAGGDIPMEMREVFVESVVVRIDEAGAVQPAAAPVEEPEIVDVPSEPVARPDVPVTRPVTSAPERPRVETQPINPPVTKPEPVRIAAPAPLPVQTPQAEAPAKAADQTPKPSEPAATTIVAAKPAPTAAAATPAVDPDAATRKVLADSLNAGVEISEKLPVAALQENDMLHASGNLIAVVRKTRLRTNVYWLEGTLNLLRTELRDEGEGRVRVLRPIAEGEGELRAVRSGGAQMFTASEPASGPERDALEQRYNDGKTISRILAPRELRAKDNLFVGQTSIVIIRRDGSSIQRMWLVGEIDLNAAELAFDGPGKYRVLTALPR
jgi:hypothetical protein